MEEYRRDAKEASEDKEIIGLYDKEKTREMIQKMQMQRERAEGIEEGIEQKTISLIKNMIKNNMDEELICRCLEITEKELISYKNKI